MSLEVLISSMNIKSIDDLPYSFNWLQKNNIPLVLVNQCTNIEPILDIREYNTIVISETNRGLSKSRNLAILNSQGEICHVSDDDLGYTSYFKSIITTAYKDNPEADIIVFQIITPKGEAYKNYKIKKKWLGIIDVAKVSSVEISFKRKSILSKNITFDENFGLGTDFPTGEEFIFLTDALKQGLKVLYIPIPIVIHPLESSGKDFDSTNLIEAKGAMLYRVFGLLGYLYSFLFGIKKYKNSSLSLISFINHMLKGIKKYRQIKK